MARRMLLAGFALLVAALPLILVTGQADLHQARGVSARDGDTIMVEFLGESEQKPVRYASVNAPGLEQCFGPEAKLCNEERTKDKDLWLELDPTDGGYREVQGRLLAHVFLSPEKGQTSSVEVLLVAQGCARLDVIDPNDTQIAQGNDFDVRYADWIIAAQLEAAKARQGWWGECDGYGASHVIIAAIKQWGEDEVVYIINRGDKSIDLDDGWRLTDASGGPRNTLDFSDQLSGECILPAGGLLRVHSGSVATGRGGEHTACGEPVIDFYWTGHNIWDNDKDEAWLYWPDGTVAYHYYYPLKWD